MKYQNTPARPGVTAIAAVLALTTTPAFAQAIVPDPLGSQAPPAANPPAPVRAAPASIAPDQTAQAQPSQAQPAQAQASQVQAPSTLSPKLPDLPVTAAKEPQQAVNAQKEKPKPVATTKSLHATAPAPTRWAVTPARPTVPPAASDAPAMDSPSDLMEPAPVAETVKPAADVAEAPAPQNGIWVPLGGGLLLAGAGAAFVLAHRRKAGAAKARADEVARRPVPVAVPERAPAATKPAVQARQNNAGQRGGRKALLEAMVAQPPSSENPFHTRKLRLRRAHYLLRTGQAPAALPEAPAVPAAAARSATDRWSEMRVAGQSPVRLSWRPVES